MLFLSVNTGNNSKHTLYATPDKTSVHQVLFFGKVFLVAMFFDFER